MTSNEFKTMKVYLDNDVVSEIFWKKNKDKKELDAMAQLLKAFNEKKVELWTSPITLREIQGFQGEKRPELERVYQC